jgi:hypothetical protein
MKEYLIHLLASAIFDITANYNYKIGLKYSAFLYGVLGVVFLVMGIYEWVFFK